MGIAKKLFKQLKAGCSKGCCLNPYCRTNLFAREQLKEFKTDQELFMHAMRLLQQQKQDPDSILCSEVLTVQSDNVDSLTDQQVMDVFEDFYMFSCSFVDKSKRDEKRKTEVSKKLLHASEKRIAFAP